MLNCGSIKSLSKRGATECVRQLVEIGLKAKSDSVVQDDIQ